MANAERGGRPTKASGAAAGTRLRGARPLGTLLLVAALGLGAARALPRPVGRRASLLAASVAVGLLMLPLPVRDTLWLGRSGVVPVLLVLLGCCAVRGARPGGACVGVAAALQPTVLLFVPLLWCTGRRPAARSAAGTFAVCTVLARTAVPHDSSTYWAHHLAGAGPGGEADDLADQSLHGALLRLGVTGPPEIALFLLLGAAVAALALRRAVGHARDGQLLLAVAVTGCATVAVSPVGRPHQLLWLLLAVVGRVGERACGRYVWPVAVVSVTTLPARMLLPNVPVLHPLRDNLVLLTVLAAATAVPFLPRTSPYHRTPVPARHAEQLPLRLPGIAPLPRRRTLTRPGLLLELLLIRVTYAGYQQVRLAATGGGAAGRATAERNGRHLLAVERFLRIDIEHAVNHAVVRAGWPRHFFDLYYESFHFAVPLAVLAVLYWRRPVDYRRARSALGLTTLLALAGFWLFPLAPPRLMPGLGFIDTVHGTQDLAHPGYGAMTAVTNQYAAMPSLHFGWSLWCGVVIAVVAPRWWLRPLGLLHPCLTVAAIVATGNHWVLDAVGGAVVVAAGFGLSYLFLGPRAGAAPPRGSGTGTAADGTGAVRCGAPGPPATDRRAGQCCGREGVPGVASR